MANYVNAVENLSYGQGSQLAGFSYDELRGALEWVLRPPSMWVSGWGGIIRIAKEKWNKYQ